MATKERRDQGLLLLTLTMLNAENGSNVLCRGSTVLGGSQRRWLDCVSAHEEFVTAWADVFRGR